MIEKKDLKLIPEAENEKKLDIDKEVLSKKKRKTNEKLI